MNPVPVAAVALFVAARADEELWELAMSIGDHGSNPDPARVRRLRRQATAHRQIADHYLGLLEESDIEALRAQHLRRVLCLLAHLDDDHPDFPAAAAGCELDCHAPPQ